YLKELSVLRDQLRIALSGVETKEGKTAPDIAERIRALRNQHSVEPAAEREARTIAAEEPVTARIRRRAETVPVSEPAMAPEDAASPKETPAPIGAWAARANAPRIRELG